MFECCRHQKLLKTVGVQVRRSYGRKEEGKQALVLPPNDRPFGH